MAFSFKKSVSLYPLIFLTGCATIMHGTTEEVGISTNPSNAAVWVNNTYIGKSPTVTTLSRKEKHTIKIELEGYQTYETIITPRLSGWVFGNIVFGGAIGLAVDALSGGIYKLTPEQIKVEMLKDNIATQPKSDKVCIAVVLEADPSWEKIDNLTRI